MENLNRIFEVTAETNSVENTPEIALSEEFSNMADKMKSLPELTCCHKEINNSTIELMFKTSVSDTCVKYNVPYEGKIWKIIQQHASDLGITFKKRC